MWSNWWGSVTDGVRQWYQAKRRPYNEAWNAGKGTLKPEEVQVEQALVPKGRKFSLYIPGEWPVGRMVDITIGKIRSRNYYSPYYTRSHECLDAMSKGDMYWTIKFISRDHRAFIKLPPTFSRGDPVEICLKLIPSHAELDPKIFPKLARMTSAITTTTITTTTTAKNDDAV